MTLACLGCAQKPLEADTQNQGNPKMMGVCYKILLAKKSLYEVVTVLQFLSIIYSFL